MLNLEQIKEELSIQQKLKGKIDAVLKEEIGKVFLQVLCDAGIYKRDEAGKEGFRRFLNSLND